MKIKYEFNGKKYIRKITDETRYDNRIFYGIGLKRTTIIYRKKEEKYYILYEKKVEDSDELHIARCCIRSLCSGGRSPERRVWRDFKDEIFPEFVDKKNCTHKTKDWTKK